jgi:rubrerythrin
MRELFNVAELVRIAIEDETSGVVFYDQIAKKTANPQLKKIFEGLAAQERYHKKRFEEMYESLGARPQREEYPGEYSQYLRTLTDGRAFPDPQTASRKALECATDAQAIDLASQFERDTLILVSEMKGLLPESDAAIVNELIREEQSHLVTLGEARRLAR